LDYFETLKDSLSGHRGFVIGNGPSLKYTDLEMLKKEITIASNKIYLAFEKVSWRPSFYTVADPLVWSKIKLQIPDSLSTVHLPSYIEKSSSNCNVYQWNCFGNYAGDGNGNHLGPIDFSDNITSGLYGTCTVTFDNLQFAAHLGLSPIFIIGCDHYYRGEKDVIKDVVVEVGKCQNHFHPLYRTEGEIVNPAPISVMERGYKEAKKFSDSSETKIFNATRGGHLEVFERVEFNDLF